MTIREYPLYVALISILVATALTSAFSFKAKVDFLQGVWNLDYLFEYVRHMDDQSYQDFRKGPPAGEGYLRMPGWSHDPMKLSKDTASPYLIGGSPGYVLRYARACGDCRNLAGESCGRRDAGLPEGSARRSGRYFFITLLGPVGDSSEHLLADLHGRVSSDSWTPACWDPATACFIWNAEQKRLTLGWERWEARPPAAASYPPCSVALGPAF